MTTAAEIVRAAIPDASDADCEHVLWGMTPFPFTRVLPKEIFRAASRLRRAGANGVQLCDHCDQRAMPDYCMCNDCADGIRAAIEATNRKYEVTLREPSR